MTPRDLEEISSFLTSVGRGDLFEYFGVQTDAPDDDVLAAVKKRRTWAQGQQSNPKYRQEALWVIKNVARCKRAMIDGRVAYMEATRSATQRKELEVLDLFIQGNLTDGVLTDRGERAILSQGRLQGLPDHLVLEQIERALAARGARRSGDSLVGPFVDHYAALGARSDAALNELERAYRDRYHAARQLPDPTEAQRVYAELDAAWDVLRNPGSRARYDERRRAELGEPDDVGPEPTPTLEPSAPTSGRLRLGGSEDDSDAPTSGSVDDAGGARLRLGGAAPAPSARATGSASAEALSLTGSAPRSVRSRPQVKVEFSGPDPLVVKVGRSALDLDLSVRRLASSPVGGRVFSDREWVRITPERLELEGTEDTISVRIEPSGMARRQAVALVTVATDDGSRSSITLDVRKRSAVPFYVAGGVALAGCVAALALAPQADAPEPPPSTATLIVTVDPPAGQLFVNGDLVSTSGSLRMDEGLPVGEPLRLRVEQDGFTTWTGETSLVAGQERRIEVALELSDPMDWSPEEEDVRADISSRDFSAALASRAAQLDRCYQKHLVEPEPGFVALTTVSAHVSARGWVVGARVEDENHPVSDELWTCIKRQMRSVKLPLFTGDYAVVKHQFRYSVPGASGQR